MEVTVLSEDTFTFPGAAELVEKTRATADVVLRARNLARLRDLQRLHESQKASTAAAKPNTYFTSTFNRLNSRAKEMLVDYYVACKPVGTICDEHSISVEDFHRLKNDAKQVLMSISPVPKRGIVSAGTSRVASVA